MKKLLNFILPSYTQWIPIIIYSHIDNKYMLQCRRNLKTGELKFKTKRLNPILTDMQGLSCSIFDAKEQFSKILLNEDVHVPYVITSFDVKKEAVKSEFSYTN